MAGEESSRELRIYIAIAIFVIVVVIFGVLFGNSNFTQAYVDDSVITNGWCENPDERDSGSQLLGFEKFGSYTYRIGVEFPAYLTITTMKTLVMMNENELRDKVVESIEKSLGNGTVSDNSSKLIGSRVLKNEHKTIFIIFNGTDNSKIPSENIKIVGEVWNCGRSGTSIVCIGVAHVSYDSKIDETNWNKMIRDKEGTFGTGELQGEDGLIYNVICH